MFHAWPAASLHTPPLDHAWVAGLHAAPPPQVQVLATLHPSAVAAQSATLLHPHAPETHAWPALLLAQLPHEPPQCAGSVSVLASQPSPGTPLQSRNGALHE